jgi:DNA-binding MarR family transcriptional regulator
VVAESHKMDRLVHERLRLGMLSALSVNERLTFVELKKLLDTTDGNLSVHSRKLEEAGYVEVTKRFEGRIPRTDYRLTDAGRQALTRYLDHMESLIQAMRDK